MRTVEDAILMVAANYRYMGTSLDREASEPQLRNMPLTRRHMRHAAIIARRAGWAEENDPDKVEPPACSICGRTRSCLAVAS